MQTIRTHYLITPSLFIRLLTIGIALFGYQLPAAAQWNMTLFNLQGIPASHSLNPGRMPLSNVYVGIPGISNMNARFSNSGFDLATLLPQDIGSSGTGDFFDTDFQRILDGLETDNQLLFDIQANWLDFGFRVQRNFFGFSLGDQAHMQLNFPKSALQLFDDINQDIIQQADKSYDLSTLGVYAQHYRTYTGSFTRMITSNLSAGVRLKYLSGLGNAHTENTGLAFDNNISNATIAVQGSLKFKTSGLSTLETSPGAYLKGNQNRGFAFDAGVQFEPIEKLELFASILNVGSILWRNDLNTDVIQSTSFSPSIDNIEDFEEDAGAFFDSLFHQTIIGQSAYRTKLPAYGYIGGNYYILPHTSVGALFSPRFFEGKTDMAISFNAQTRLRKIIQVGLNYTLLTGNHYLLGAGASLNLGPLQVFVASDNLLSAFQFQTSQQAQVNLGMSLAFGRRTRAAQRALWTTDQETEIAEEMPMEAEQATDAPEEITETKPRKTKNQQPAPVSPNTLPETPPTVAPNPSTPVPTSTATTGRSRYITLTGVALNKATNESVKGVQIDVYIQLPDGTEKFAMTHHFFNGVVQVQLERDKNYRVRVYKPSIGKYDVLLPASMLQDIDTLERKFILE